MSSSLWAMTVIMTLGGGPYGCQTCDAGGMQASGFASGGYGGSMYSGGGASGGGIYSTGMGLNAYSGSNGDTLHPWDTQEAWMHGYFQEISPYSGYNYFRPYNYKHVLSQVDLSYRWGNQQGMPYSHQWWHRYHLKASVSPTLHQNHLSQHSAQGAQVQTVSAYDVEMARLRAWRDFQAEQRMTSAPVGYQYATPNQPPYAASTLQPQAAPMMFDPASQAAYEQQQGSRGFVVPATPNVNFPRSAEAPMIPEFNPQYAPSGPALR